MYVEKRIILLEIVIIDNDGMNEANKKKKHSTIQKIPPRNKLPKYENII